MNLFVWVVGQSLAMRTRAAKLRLYSEEEHTAREGAALLLSRPAVDERRKAEHSVTCSRAGWPDGPHASDGFGGSEEQLAVRLEQLRCVVSLLLLLAHGPRRTARLARAFTTKAFVEVEALARLRVGHCNELGAMAALAP